MYQYKFLVCISSFKRPIHVLGQIHRFFKQSYQNFDISVVVRGCDNHVNNLISEECSIYSSSIDSPSLTLQYGRNKDQLNNLLDCIRYIDYTKYDFFCKIDDDDIYSLQYLENINKKLNEYQNKNIIGFRNRSPLRIIIEDQNYVQFSNCTTALYGNTLGFSKYIYTILDEVANDRSNIVDIMLKYNYSLPNPMQYVRSNVLEDKFIDHTMMALTKDDNVYVDINLSKQLYYCKLTPGIVEIKKR